MTDTVDPLRHRSVFAVAFSYREVKNGKPKKNQLVRLIVRWPAFIDSFVRSFLLAHARLPKCWDNKDEYARISGCEGVIVPPRLFGGAYVKVLHGLLSLDLCFRTFLCVWAYIKPCSLRSQTGFFDNPFRNTYRSHRLLGRAGGDHSVGIMEWWKAIGCCCAAAHSGWPGRFVLLASVVVGL